MKQKCCCIICGKEYSYKGINTHYDRVHADDSIKEKYSSGNNGKYHLKEYKEKIRSSIDSRLGSFLDFEVECSTCSTVFQVKEREKLFPSKEKYYCSRKCANTKNHTEETKKKIKESRIKNNYKYEKPLIYKKCLNCNEEFTTKRSSQKFCSKSCVKNHKKTKRGDLASYRQKCLFNFNLADYADEFDFNLVKEHGWYSPSNKRNNLTGVSRDHMVSVKYGFLNNIPSEHIRHPANCKLMLHSNNVSKYESCSITYEELLERIEYWNNKYNPTI